MSLPKVTNLIGELFQLVFHKGLVYAATVFLIYVNELTDVESCNIKLYAADTILYLSKDQYKIKRLQ